MHINVAFQFCCIYHILWRRSRIGPKCLEILSNQSLASVVSQTVPVKLMCFTCLYSRCLWAFCLRILCTCIIATSKVVTVSSLQLSAVVLPPKLLQMVDKSTLVLLLDPQWPTTVTQGTVCKATMDIPAWPMDSGMVARLLAIVSCTLFYFYFYLCIKSPAGQWYCSVMTVEGSPESIGTELTSSK